MSRGSFAQVPGRVVDDRDLGHGALLVLVALCTYADKTDHCWPAASTLAQRLGVTERHVRRCLKELTERGYIETSREYAESGKEGVAVRHIVHDRQAEEIAICEGVTPRVRDDATGHPCLGVTPEVRDDATRHVRGDARGQTEHTNEHRYISPSPSAPAAMADGTTRQPHESSSSVAPETVIGVVVPFTRKAPSKRTRKSPSALHPALAMIFTEIWEQFPRKPGSPRAAAEAHFAKALAKGEAPDDIRRGALNFAVDFEQQNNDVEYAPYLRTFIAERRYRDWLEMPTRRHDSGAL